MSDCVYCGDDRHDSDSCAGRPRVSYADQLKPPPHSLEQDLAISLKGAASGRRIGWLRAQNKAAVLVLEMSERTEEGLRLYRAIMDMADELV